jgi:hypothetical protein
MRANGYSNATLRSAGLRDHAHEAAPGMSPGCSATDGLMLGALNPLAHRSDRDSAPPGLLLIHSDLVRMGEAGA